MAKYGCIKDFEKLKKPKHDENQPNNAHNVPSRGGEEVQPRQRGEQDLEMNHTHYILLDDGTLRQYDTEDYRTRLVQEIANDISIVPTVTIVVEGGRDTIKNMYYDLRRNIPVIIIDGSGRAADFFTRWLSYTKDEDSEDIKLNNNGMKDRDSDLPIDIGELYELPKDSTSRRRHQSDMQQLTTEDESNERNTSKTFSISDKSCLHSLVQKFDAHVNQIKDELAAIVSRDDELPKAKVKKQVKEKVDDCILQVLYCLQRGVRSNITIFKLDNDNDLSTTIFRSICKSHQKLIEKSDISRMTTAEYDQARLHPRLMQREKEIVSESVRHETRDEVNLQKDQLLDLALSWDAIEVAKELIIKGSLDNIICTVRKKPFEVIREYYPFD
ncbi:unnamed protein product [Didymodactylos carnosus]|uniref:TRPM SLOG domain-containing protein n=1 Tax=Didymodactylos carnosus TaxID=1234261 RepID=A0A8S2KKW1_9BILA|nr:unnamed protein product [Didymodactylos carnosus]CAF3856884.1 unnamed protein product [Didymodactylos carnosus]